MAMQGGWSSSDHLNSGEVLARDSDPKPGTAHAMSENLRAVLRGRPQLRRVIAATTAVPSHSARTNVAPAPGHCKGNQHPPSRNQNRPSRSSVAMPRGQRKYQALLTRASLLLPGDFIQRAEKIGLDAGDNANFTIPRQVLMPSQGSA